MFGDLYPDVSVPKNAGRWIASVQHHMARAGQHRSASAVDLMIAATAAHHGLTVLHDDADYRTVAARAGLGRAQHPRCRLTPTRPAEELGTWLSGLAPGRERFSSAGSAD